MPIVDSSFVSHWKLNEASGVRIDSHGTNHLTDNNTVGSSAAGKIGGAASFVRMNDEWLSIPSNTSLQTGGQSVTIAAWCKPISTAYPLLAVACKGSHAGTEWGLALYGLVDGQNAGTFHVKSRAVEVFSPSGSIAVNAWNLLIGWVDVPAGTVNLQINNGSVSTLALGSTSVSNDIGLVIGQEVLGYANFDGLIDEVLFTKRVLDASERTKLWNNGNGLAYPFTPSNVTILVKAGVSDAVSAIVTESVTNGLAASSFLPGEEYTLPLNRLHYRISGRLHYTLPRGELHYTLPSD